MKEFNTLEKAKLISDEIKKKLDYDCKIEIFNNEGHIVTFFSYALISNELELLTEIKNKFQNNY